MRKELISKLLNVPFISILLKYDYYIKCTLVSKHKMPIMKEVIVTSNDQIIIHSNKGIELYDLNNIQKSIGFFEGSRHVTHIKLIPNNRIITYNGRYFQVWNIDTLKIEHQIVDNYWGYMIDICIVSDNTIAIYEVNKNDIKVWHFEKEPIILKGHLEPVIHVLPFKDKLLSASDDDTLKIWNLNTGKSEFRLQGHEHAITDVNIMENLILSSSVDKSIRIWNSSGICKGIIETTDTVKKILVYENRIITINSHDKDIRVWNIESICEATLTGHKYDIDDIQLLPNNDIISSSLVNNELRIWDISTYRCINTWNINYKNFIVHNQKLIVYDTHNISIWH